MVAIVIKLVGRAKRVFKRHTSRTHFMLSRSSQSVAVSLMFSMDNSVAKYMSTALIPRFNTISSKDIEAHLSKNTETLEHEINQIPLSPDMLNQLEWR